MSAYFNLGSILLGLIAWTIPIVVIKPDHKIKIKNTFFSLFSFSACIGALCLQIFEMSYRVKVQDWSALMDTCGVLIRVVILFVVITVILNVIALKVFYEKEVDL